MTKTTMPLLVAESVAHMTPQQFAAYDAALRSIDYYALNPEDQGNYVLAIRAANERRSQEGLNVTITDGMRSPLTQIQAAVAGVPKWALIAGAAVAVYLLAGR